jgi:hypothetical protein
MKTRPLAVALLVALAPATLPVTAVAQSGAEDPVTAMARARFKEGVDFYDKGQFEQARAAFLQAYALKKHPAVLLNLAWSCLKSGHALDAERYFRQFLTDGKDITDKQRADATDGLTQSRGKIGRIEVVAPAGTEITIDGDRAGSAPLSDPVAVEPGAHTVMFKGPDTATDTQSVSVLGGERAVVRFKRASADATATAPDHATPPPAATTQPPPEPPPEAPPPPPEEEKPPVRAQKETPEEHGGPGLFSPPDNLVPVVIGGVLTGAGVAVAIAMLVGKNAAADSQASTATQVTNAGLRCDPALDPRNPNAPPSADLASACSSYDNDIANQNTDATVGNIAVGVAVAAALGTVIYWLVADKSGGSDSHARRALPVVPMLSGTTQGGNFSLTGQF